MLKKYQRVVKRWTLGEWLLGLIHGKPCDLQAVVRTEGCDGKTVG